MSIVHGATSCDTVVSTECLLALRAFEVLRSSLMRLLIVSCERTGIV